MKKVLNSKLFIFIVTAIVFTGIGAFAATQITAADIEYATNVSVKDKLDDLYTTQSTTVTNLQSANSTLTTANESLTSENQTLTTNYNNLNSQYNSLLTDYNTNVSGTTVYHGSSHSDVRKASNQVSVELPAGKYVCTVTYVSSGVRDVASEYLDPATTYNLPTITGCTITNNYSLRKRQASKEKATENNIYYAYNILESNFVCDTNTSTTLMVDLEGNANTQISIGAELICNKIK